MTAHTVIEQLRGAGLRPTRQRVALASLLLDGRDRHVSAEALFQEAQAAGIGVSLATIYNALHDFTERGLLREISIDSGRSYFDTNISVHHHFFYERSGRLEDISFDDVQIANLPATPDGLPIKSVEVIIRIDG